jgi:hypothetical protein
VRPFRLLRVYLQSQVGYAYLVAHASRLGRAAGARCARWSCVAGTVEPATT